MNGKEARVKSLWAPPDSAAAAYASGAQIGRLCAISPQGSITIELLPAGRTCLAKLAVAADREQLQEAMRSEQPVVVVFENADQARPIIVGFITPPLPLVQAEVSGQTTDASPVIDADVDGRRVRVVAKDEIVFECGAASITLRRNGRIVIRGTHVESYSEGTNRIKGGQVRIN